MLTRAERQRYEARLLEERDRATSVVDQSRRDQVAEGEERDSADRASLETERELDQLVSTCESGTVASIDAALRVLATAPAEYGICEICKAPIPRARLDIVPWALTCEGHGT
jgi:DnaK suppressor protein